MARLSWIILFEDKQKKREELTKLITRFAGDEFRVHPFNPDKELSASGAYEDQLKSSFGSKNFAEIVLFVSDRDLSANASPGLSETNVSKAAALLGIPVGIYAAGKDDSVLERQRSGGDGRIVLDSEDLETMARRIAALAQGFAELGRLLPKAMKEARGPGPVLARALEHPEVSAQIALYASGDQRMIAELMPSKGKGNQASEQKRMATALGTWLYDSLLRFPGVVVNRVAAASFLNIAPRRLSEPKIAGVFSSALYRGPFSSKEEPRWWRHLLSDLLDKNAAKDGGALIRKKIGENVGPCPCSVDGKAPAGFFCAITQEPVCINHSVGQISWLPRGADLTRVAVDQFDELSPWIGVS